MIYIVHGATGAQGSPVLELLRSANKPVIAAVRGTNASPEGVQSVSVDLSDAAALTALYREATGVFIHLPIDTPARMAEQANAISTAIEQAKPARIVISTSGQVVDQPNSPLQAPSDSPIQTLIRRASSSDSSVAVVAPRLYLENLLLPITFGPVTTESVLRYPLPDSYPVSWSSHLDVAEAVVRLLDDPAVTGTVAVGHKPGLTGADLAAAFSQHLDHDIGYEAITPAEFGQLLTPLFGPAADPIVGLYQALNLQTEYTIADQNSAQQILNLRPRPVTQWMSDVMG